MAMMAHPLEPQAETHQACVSLSQLTATSVLHRGTGLEL